MKKYKIVILYLLLLAIIVGFYFKDNILNYFYNNLGVSLQKFVPTSSRILDEIGKKINLVNTVNEIRKEIFTPAPLKIGGKANESVFTQSKIIAQTNIQRYNNGMLTPLIENAKLNEAAKVKAEDMFKNQYFEHISPFGVDPGKLVKSEGYDYVVTGENLILGNFKDEEEIVQHWMDSPGHRANILNNRFADIGAAIVKGAYKGEETWIGVQEFGLPLSACSQPNINTKNQINSSKDQLDQSSLKIDAKRKEIENTNPKSAQYNTLVDEYNQLVAEYNSLTQETKNLILQYNNQVNTFNQCVVGE